MDIREQYRMQAIQFTKEWREDVSEHILDIMVSIMCTRDKTSYPGGGFVESIVKNDLVGAVSRADNDCIKHIKLLALCSVNCHLNLPLNK